MGEGPEGVEDGYGPVRRSVGGKSPYLGRHELLHSGIILVKLSCMLKKVIFSMGIISSLFIGKAARAQGEAKRDTITYYRKQIDTLDKQIIDLLGERMKAARAIGTYKMDHQIGVVQSARFEEVLQHGIERGKKQGLSEEFVRALYNDVHRESVHQQELLQAARKKE